MKIQKNPPGKGMGFRVPRIFGTALLFLAAAAGMLFAGDHLSASISGNTVNYSVSGVEKNADFKILIKNVGNGQQEKDSGHSDDRGNSAGGISQTPTPWRCPSVRGPSSSSP